MRRYLTAHLSVALAYVVLLVGMGLLGGKDLSSSSYWIGIAELFAGVLLGVWILFFDRIVYTFSYPNEQLSQHYVWLWKQKKRREALALLDQRRSEQQKLTFRSGLFMVVWVLLAFFALTSTVVMFGKGVVMGLMLHILYDSWRLQRMDSSRLNTRLFWQIGRQVSYEEQLVFLYVMSGMFILFSFWIG